MSNVITLKTGELFSGAGGLGLGFVLAGHPYVRFLPKFAFDSDPHAVASYRYNMGWLSQYAPDVLGASPHVYVRDVEKLNTKAVLRLSGLEQGELDLLLGGPPCQGFSTSNRKGKAQQKHDRNRLVKVFLDKLAELQPRMFLMENVQGMRWTEPTAEMLPACDQGILFPEAQVNSVQSYLITSAKSLGYHVWYALLDAASFGVPQHRQRFVLFGVRNDIAHDEEAVNLSPIIERLIIPAPVTVLDAIGDLPSLQNGQSWASQNYHPNTSAPYVVTMRRFMSNGDVFDHFATKHNEIVIERYKRIPQGGNWESVRDLMTNYSSVENTHSNIYRRLVADLPAHTISHYRKSMIIHPLQDRGLSMREACRLQSFPDWFRFSGPIDNQQQQLGNAVPPLMASAIAYAIGECWQKLRSRQTLSVEPYLARTTKRARTPKKVSR